jgi:hypothetical protein
MVPTTADISPSPKKKKSVSRCVGSQLVSLVALPSITHTKCAPVLLFPENWLADNDTTLATTTRTHISFYIWLDERFNSE